MISIVRPDAAVGVTIWREVRIRAGVRESKTAIVDAELAEDLRWLTAAYPGIP